MTHKRKKGKAKKRISAWKTALFFLTSAALLITVMLRIPGSADSGNNDMINAPATSAENLSAENAAEPTPTPTLEPTPTPTPEPTPELFTLSFIGDNTLCANKQFEFSDVGFTKVVGEDYSYPYSNTKQYFEQDEMTFANLECTFSDEKLAHDYTIVQFPFLAPTANTQILTSGGVDFVTMANNHTMDFFDKGVTSTKSTLEAAGLPYGYENQGQILESPHGLKIGVWTAGNDLLPNQDKAVQGVKDLKASGADIVICMFHWGQEIYYSPNDNQKNLAHACVDAGADIVYGTHTHCLQPIEEYGNGIIMYSLGNWVFGGNTQPTDPDTAIIQIIIKRDLDGTVSRDSFKAIPCCISSKIDGGNAKANNGDYNLYANYNDYKPTPYVEGSEGYERAISKLNGSFVAKSEGADYSAYYASWQ